MPNDAAVWAALVTGSLALVGTIITASVGYWSQRRQAQIKADSDTELSQFRANTDIKLTELNARLVEERDERIARLESEKIISKFRDPLLYAAYDLQSRIYNTLNQDFLGKFYARGSDQEKEYAVENTVFLVAQYLGWTELIRREIQFLDLGTDQQTQDLRQLQDDIYSLFQSDSEEFGERFRLFAGEQRAVGELMIDNGSGTPRCIGYATFLRNRNPNIDHWLDPLREDVRQMSSNTKPYETRLIEIQHAMIDLLEFLDPKYIRFPERTRSKL